ncbi:MAG TPA: molecular chaperone TorD family protein [Candidatus Acidoferrales bacterium]|nr:molecular chaperone TorD family protein [Candidatus Acidoferrales bacterium]
MNATVELEASPHSDGWEQVDLYRFFAHVLAAPTRERHELLRSRNFVASLRQLWKELKCDGEFPAVKRFRGYQKYESAYIALFDAGAPEPPVPLVESGHYKSVPAQQIALENVLFYEVLGLHVDTARSFPDHLQTQLQFLSAVRYAGENADDAASRASLLRLEADFLRRHLLNWLPTAEKKLRKLDPPLFPVLLCLLVAFLQNRRMQLSRLS